MEVEKRLQCNTVVYGQYYCLHSVKIFNVRQRENMLCVIRPQVPDVDLETYVIDKSHGERHPIQGIQLSLGR